MLASENALKEYKKKDLLRTRLLIKARKEGCLTLNGQRVIHFCSNDYLNLSDHPDVKKSFARAAHEYGLGSGSSSLIAGYTQPHYLLEEALAEFLKRERALLFNSGYHANLGVFNTFANRNTTVFSDKLCHASLIDGIILSRAKHYRYANHDPLEAEQSLIRYKTKQSLIVTESIFSMEGTLAAIPALAALAKKHQSFLIVDDAHALGVLGTHGRGALEHFGLAHDLIPCLISPFGKALGSFGAVVTGSHALVETLIQFARTYRYSTSLPPAVCAATLTALKIMAKESWRREKLVHLATLFNHEASLRNLPLVSTDLTPIKCILIQSNKLTLALQDHLLQKGFLISAIRPPTVPLHTARLRLSLNCLHSPLEIIQLLDEIAFFLQKNKRESTT